MIESRPEQKPDVRFPSKRPAPLFKIHDLEETMSIEDSLRRAYLANGGTEDGFESVKGELIVQYRNQAMVNAALEEAKKPVTLNDLMRAMAQEHHENNADRFRLLLGNQKGNPDAA